MKRILALALCVLLAAALTGCGGAKPAETPAAAPAATEAPKPTEAPAAPTEAPAAPTEAPAVNETAELVEKILAMKGRPVADLYALVGEPTGAVDYTPSCLVTGGKDGQLEYDGFTVYTLVQPDGSETIYDCE